MMAMSSPPSRTVEWSTFSHPNDQQCRRNDERKLRRVVSKLSGKFTSGHDQRRAFGTRSASKVKPATLQLLMRHESIETTLKYYVAQDADDIAAELWGQYSATSNIPGNTRPEAKRNRSSTRGTTTDANHAN